MDWDVQSLTRSQASKLLHGAIVPRPIALVTTLNADGTTNAAPFSFFNILCTEPAVLALGLDGREAADDGLKDTARNIQRSGEFVVNLVDEPLVPLMTVCAVEFPAGVDETVQAQLKLTPSTQVTPPRIAVSPVQFECRLRSQLPLGAGRAIFIADIVHIHARDGLVNERFHVDPEKLNLIGRLEGSGWYTRIADRFQMPQMTYQQWLADRERLAAD